MQTTISFHDNGQSTNREIEIKRNTFRRNYMSIIQRNNKSATDNALVLHIYDNVYVLTTPATFSKCYINILSLKHMQHENFALV